MNKKLRDLGELEKPMVVEIKPTIIIKVVEIQSLIESHLVYIGKSTGRQYEWLRAGDTVSIDERDVPELLEKRLGKKTCCGNGENRIFQIALGGNHAQ